MKAGYPVGELPAMVDSLVKVAVAVVVLGTAFFFNGVVSRMYYDDGEKNLTRILQIHKDRQ